MTMVELKSPDGKVSGYLAVPKTGSGPALLVLHACWGLWLAQELPADVAAVVLFYGTGDGNYSQIRAAFLGHFAETDEFESPAVVQDLEKILRTTSGKNVTFHSYSGTTHWFFEKDRPDAYDAQAARLAWQRTIRFLKTQLPGEIG